MTHNITHKINKELLTHKNRRKKKNKMMYYSFLVFISCLFLISIIALIQEHMEVGHEEEPIQTNYINNNETSSLLINSYERSPTSQKVFYSREPSQQQQQQQQTQIPMNTINNNNDLNNEFRTSLMLKTWLAGTCLLLIPLITYFIILHKKTIEEEEERKRQMHLRPPRPSLRRSSCTNFTQHEIKEIQLPRDDANQSEISSLDGHTHCIFNDELVGPTNTIGLMEPPQILYPPIDSRNLKFIVCNKNNMEMTREDEQLEDVEKQEQSQHHYDDNEDKQHEQIISSKHVDSSVVATNDSNSCFEIRGFEFICSPSRDRLEGEGDDDEEDLELSVLSRHSDTMTTDDEDANMDLVPSWRKLCCE